MFEAGGCIYVYFTYGMHHCLNIVTGPAGLSRAVLLRGGESWTESSWRGARRPAARVDRDLARGPARLCAALGLDRSDDGTLLGGPGSRISLTLPEAQRAPDAERIRRGPRTGVAGPGGRWRSLSMALLAGWRAHRLDVPARRHQATLAGLNLTEFQAPGFAHLPELLLPANNGCADYRCTDYLWRRTAEGGGRRRPCGRLSANGQWISRWRSCGRPGSRCSPVRSSSRREIVTSRASPWGPVRRSG